MGGALLGGVANALSLDHCAQTRAKGACPLRCSSRAYTAVGSLSCDSEGIWHARAFCELVGDQQPLRMSGSMTLQVGAPIPPESLTEFANNLQHRLTLEFQMQALSTLGLIIV